MSRNLVFISYSHKDKKWFEALKTHLFPIVNNDESLLQVWDDKRINVGDNWDEEIKKAINQTKIAVLLVSPNFLASRYIKDNELPPLLNADKADEATIFWIPIRSSSYKFTEIQKYQPAHDPQTPLADLTVAKRDRAWVEIVARLDKAYSSNP